MRSPFIKPPARQVQARTFAMVNSQVTLSTGYVYGACTVTLSLTGGGGSGGGGLPSDTYGIVGVSSNNGEYGGTAERNKSFANKFIPAAGGVLTIPSRVSVNPHSVTVSYSGTWANWQADGGNNGLPCQIELPAETLSASGGIAGRGAYISELSGSSSYFSNPASTSYGYGGFGVIPSRVGDNGWKSSNARGRGGEAKLTLKGN